MCKQYVAADWNSYEINTVVIATVATYICIKDNKSLANIMNQNTYISVKSFHM